MTIEDKYLKLLGMSIYNKTKDKFGYICSIEISYGINGYYINFNVYYDTFDNNNLLFFEDFKKDATKFVIFTDEYIKDVMQKTVEEIQEVFGEEFSEDMLLYVSDNEKRARNLENDQKNVQMLHTDLIDLTNISAEVMANDFYSRELYLKYKKEIITKEELLYSLINHLAQELKRVKDSNVEYFFKYEFSDEINRSIINE